MHTTITTFDGVRYTMSLERDSEHDEYVLTFTSQHRFIPRTEVHRFKEYTTAWEHYARNCHYYNNVILEPLTEEQFLGLQPGTLYQEDTDAKAVTA